MFLDGKSLHHKGVNFLHFISQYVFKTRGSAFLTSELMKNNGKILGNEKDIKKIQNIIKLQDLKKGRFDL